MRTPTLERAQYGGVQRLYRFANGYGASVIRHEFSMGVDEGLWEACLIRFDGSNIEEFILLDDDDSDATGLPSGVMGYLSDGAVDEWLVVIEGLADPTPTLTLLGFF